MGADYDTANRQEPGRLNTGITVVGKRAVIPAGVRIGRNCKINEEVRPTDFGGRRNIPSGGTVEIKRSGGGKGKLGAAKGQDGEPIAERMSAAPPRGR